MTTHMILIFVNIVHILVAPFGQMWMNKGIKQNLSTRIYDNTHVMSFQTKIQWVMLY